MEIYYSPKAKEDLWRIRESILSTWDDESLVVQVIGKITKSIRNLEQFPYMGEKISSTLEIPSSYRCLFSSHNYIFYRIEKERIFIVRILNEKQDYMRILFGNTEETN